MCCKYSVRVPKRPAVPQPSRVVRNSIGLVQLGRNNAAGEAGGVHRRHHTGGGQVQRRVLHARQLHAAQRPPRKLHRHAHFTAAVNSLSTLTAHARQLQATLVCCICMLLAAEHLQCSLATAEEPESLPTIEAASLMQIVSQMCWTHVATEMRRARHEHHLHHRHMHDPGLGLQHRWRQQ